MSYHRLLVTGSTLSVVHIVLQVMVSFFMMPFIISHLGKELYGVWILIAAFVGYYGLLDFGIGGAVTRFMSRAIGAGHREKIRYYASSAFFVLSCAGLGIITISILASFLSSYFIQDNDKLILFRTSVIILGLSIGVSFPLRVFEGVLTANLRVDLKRYLEIFEIFFRTVAVVIVLKMGFGIIGLASVSALAMVTDFILKTIVSFKIDSSVKIRVKYCTKDTIHEMKDFTVFNFIRSGAEILSNRIDAYTVALVSNISSVAYYGVALNLTNYITQFFRAFTSILEPLLSQKDGAKDVQGIGRVFIFMSRICVILSTFIVMLIFFYSNQFIQRWLGPDFNDSYLLVLILAVPFIVAHGFLPSANVLGNTGRHRINAYLDIIQGVINLCISIILGIFFGPVGVALGTAIPLVIVGGFARSYYACNVVEISPLIYWYEMFSTFLKTVVLIVPIWFLWGRNIDASYIAIFSISLAHLTVFCLAGIFILFPKDDSRMIRNFVLSSLKVNRKLAGR